MSDILSWGSHEGEWETEHRRQFTYVAQPTELGYLMPACHHPSLHTRARSLPPTGDAALADDPATTKDAILGDEDECCPASACDNRMAKVEVPTAKAKQLERPPFHTYGRGNVNPATGGFIYGNYLATHNSLRRPSTTNLARTHYQEADIRREHHETSRTKAAPLSAPAAKRMEVDVDRPSSCQHPSHVIQHQSCHPHKTSPYPQQSLSSSHQPQHPYQPPQHPQQPPQHPQQPPQHPYQPPQHPPQHPQQPPQHPYQPPQHPQQPPQHPQQPPQHPYQPPQHPYQPPQHPQQPPQHLYPPPQHSYPPPQPMYQPLQYPCQPPHQMYQPPQQMYQSPPHQLAEQHSYPVHQHEPGQIVENYAWLPPYNPSAYCTSPGTQVHVQSTMPSQLPFEPNSLGARFDPHKFKCMPIALLRSIPPAGVRSVRRDNKS
ncbi:hypothetical protein AB1Y20_014547 [Prymnesium parvum]|uniref:Uncharacterized protein n=1 Tax=Prymnesium parvum TaxID=97485 RepID=A0AB34IEB4_PRYPA